MGKDDGMGRKSQVSDGGLRNDKLANSGYWTFLPLLSEGETKSGGGGGGCAGGGQLNYMPSRQSASQQINLPFHRLPHDCPSTDQKRRQENWMQ